jgi:hypothetical protein
MSATPTPIAQTEDTLDALDDAQAAHGSISVLIELLGGCEPGQQVTGVFMRSLLMDVRMHLDNVVEALRYAPA